MIKIEFSGLSFQDEDFKDETFSEGSVIYMTFNMLYIILIP